MTTAGLTIERVDTRILDVPLIRPHGFATTTATEQSILLVSVTTADGVTGLGEGVVPGGPWWGGESVETMKPLVDRYLAPVMVGRRVDELAGVLADMEKVVANARFAKAACDVAMHDARGHGPWVCPSVTSSVAGSVTVSTSPGRSVSCLWRPPSPRSRSGSPPTATAASS